MICVTCTGGELGEIVVPEMDTPENTSGSRRRGPARWRGRLPSSPRKARIEHRWLGYRDSGMMGTAGNDDPRAFWQADWTEAWPAWSASCARCAADVVSATTTSAATATPITSAPRWRPATAFEAAGDPAAYPEQLGGDDALEPWAPTKLYESVLQFSRLEELQAELAARGIESPWGPREDESAEEQAEREAWLARMAEATGPITTRSTSAASWSASWRPSRRT